jgi:hypothetical protein
MNVPVGGSGAESAIGDHADATIQGIMFQNVLML